MAYRLFPRLQKQKRKGIIMKWTKLTIDTTTAAEDMISYALSELGIEGIEIEDHVPLTEEEKARMYVDLLPDEIAPDDGTARISCYIDPEVNMDELVKQIKEQLDEIEQFLPVGPKTITIGETEDKDWINNWKQFFKPFRVNDHIIIKPTWEVLEDKKETDTVVEIDPGTAFGTGSHHTTKLCIHQLDKYMKKGDRLLDVGCGSGILSIIGLKLGAGFAVGTDIDEHAISATLENLEKNGLTDENMEVFQGNILSDQETKDRVGYEKYDIVLANILADVLVPLSEIIRPHMKKGGLIVMSGIINTKEEEVKDALLRNGFEIVEITYSGEWVAITAK